MKFDQIPKQVTVRWGAVYDVEKFQSFQRDFKIISVNFSGQREVSAQYFIDLLTKSATTRPPYYSERQYNEFCRACNKFQGYKGFQRFFDHSAFWRCKNNYLIITTMPYMDKDGAETFFDGMALEFSFPTTIKMRFMGDKYRYRPNGTHMILIYDEERIWNINT